MVSLRVFQWQSYFKMPWGVRSIKDMQYIIGRMGEPLYGLNLYWIENYFFQGVGSFVTEETAINYNFYMCSYRGHVNLFPNMV